MDLVSSLFGVGGILSAVVTWMINRKKTNADITEQIANAASVITTTNQSLITSLNSRIEELEEEVKHLTSQNDQLIRKLYEIGTAILETDGEHIPKATIAKLLR